MSNSNTNPFTSIIPLEEITHFQKPHKPLKSILTNYKTKFQTKKVSYSPGIDVNEFSDLGESGGESEEKDEDEENANASGQCGQSSSFTFMNEDSNAERNDRISYNSDESDGSEGESDTEFRRDFTQLPTNGREQGSFGNLQNFNVFNDKESGSSKIPEQKQNNLNAGTSPYFLDRGISDENLFPVSNSAIDVTKADFVFAFCTFLIHFLGILTDFGLGIWHYNVGFPWASGLTFLFIGFGGIGMLQQFGILQQDQLDRTFRKGKRMRILVNCFPWGASSLVALEGTIEAYRSLKDPMHSQQFFRICEIQQSLSRVQSLFQSSILGVLQLTVWMENLSESSESKGWMTFFNLVLSLAIMTCANLPCKTDSSQASNNKTAFLPLTRLFVGARMFSSLGSRCMAVSFLLLGCRCILKYIEDEEFSGTRGERDPTLASTIVGLFLLLFPRLVFSLTDLFSFRRERERVAERYRDQPELALGVGESVGGKRVMLGYLATICFPVGDPFWLFWYLWAESGVFMVFGIVAANTHSCLGGEEWVLILYVGVFLTAFLVVPCAIPAAKAAVQRRKVERVRRVLQVGLDVEDQERGESGVA